MGERTGDNDHQHAAAEADFSDYHDKTLSTARAAEVEAHLAACERCRSEYRRFQSALEALSGLHRVSAPPNFENQVAETIHRRSAGRFFGRRAFGDRVPFELVAIVALVGMVTAYWILWTR
jgi:anti-sigma factor RsiW